MDDKEQILFDKFVDVLIDKLDTEPSDKDLAVILKFIAYEGIQADPNKHKGVNKLVKDAMELPFDNDDELPLKRIK